MCELYGKVNIEVLTLKLWYHGYLTVVPWVFLMYKPYKIWSFLNLGFKKVCKAHLANEDICISLLYLTAVYLQVIKTLGYNNINMF